MRFKATQLADVMILMPEIFFDHRGDFRESFRQKEFEHYCGHYSFVQDNLSRSVGGTLRGLHYQCSHPQGKLIQVITGQIFDVAVDIRKSSPTFGKWVGVHLSGENKRQLWIPEGFAHGFLTLSESAEFLYKTTNYYSPTHERSILWSDKNINIKWSDMDLLSPVVSKKDIEGKFLLASDLFE